MNADFRQQKQKTITIYAAIHRDVPESVKASIYVDHFRPFVQELESFTDRKVNVVLGAGEPFRSFDYKGEDLTATLLRWERLGRQYLDLYRAEGFDMDDVHVVVLVTGDSLTSSTLGAALTWPPKGTGQFAIASVTGYQVIGHEIGHLLGAKHEDSEISFNGWWGESYMTPERQILRSNSYRFSETNRNNIKNYLATRN